MAEIVRFEVKGLRKLDRALQKLPEAVAGRALTKAALAAAKPIKQQMLGRVAVDRGQMFIDLDARVSRANVGKRRVTISIGPSIQTGWRVHFLEFGTQFQPAQPFMRPALDAAAPEAIRIFKRELKIQIKRAKL